MTRLGSIVLAAVIVACTTSSAFAHPSAYVSTVQQVPCRTTFEIPPCTRGVVSVVDTASGQTTSTIELWEYANTFPSVIDLAVNPIGTRLYATLSSGTFAAGRGQVLIFDLVTQTRIGEIPGTGPGAGGMLAFSSDGRVFETRSTDVLVFDAVTNAPITTFENSFPVDIEVSSDNSRIYVTKTNSTVDVRDGTTYALLNTITLPAPVQSIQLSADGAHLYAAMGTSGVADIDTATNDVAGVISFGGAQSAQRLAFARGRAYVTVRDTSTPPPPIPAHRVAIVDVATRTISSSLSMTQEPLGIAVASDESRVFVTTASELRSIDPLSNQFVASASVSVSGPALAVRPTPFSALFIDTPAGATTVEQPFDIGGWAVDVFGFGGGPGVDVIHVWAYPAGGGAPSFVGAAEYGRDRPDIAALLGSTYLDSGYVMTVRGLAAGAYTLVVYGRSTRTGAFSLARAVPVTIVPSVHLMIDAPFPGGYPTPTVGTALLSLPFDIVGWAIDREALSGTGIDAIHVWAFPSRAGVPLAPIFLGAATLGEPRPDVAAIYGPQFAASGYRLRVSNLSRWAAQYTIHVYAHQASTGAFTAVQMIHVAMYPVSPYLFVDVPAANATVPPEFVVAGWAAETNAGEAPTIPPPPGTGVDLIHVWATPTGGGTPVFLGEATYGIERPDVAAFLGSRYLPSGYSLTARLAPGTYVISVYARSTSSNLFEQVRPIAVTVQ